MSAAKRRKIAAQGEGYAFRPSPWVATKYDQAPEGAKESYDTGTVGTKHQVVTHFLMRIVLIIAFLAASLSFAHTGAEPEFEAVTQWKIALRANDLAVLRSLYSTNPPATSIGKDKRPHDISEEISFWQQLKSSGLKDLQLIQRESGDQQGLHIVSLTISFHVQTPDGPRTRYVLEDQGWQLQGGTWRIVVAKHSDVVKMPQPGKLNPGLYPPNVDAKAEIKEAVARSGREHKRVILVFGANWCYDCHVLDFALHQADLAKIAAPNFIIVHVDIGEGKLNNDIAAQYKTPLEHGIPALAVLNSDGTLLYSQQHGEFEAARSMDPDVLIAFLNRWKP